MTVLVGTRGGNSVSARRQLKLLRGSTIATLLCTLPLVVKTFATELVPAQVRSYTVANQQTPAQKWEYV
ncbi:hypothetical protein LZ32DRAFT_600071 [Colletotrichum eremochloae]|nr:hypothetical protein LZ32DRAFT_600071 [Colletotrichum eremochloae]